MSNLWPLERLEELTTKVGSGATPKGGESAYQKTGVPLIRSMNVVFFGFKKDGLAFLNTEQAASLQNVEVRKGDVLLNITGASIGRVTLAPADMDGARVNQHVCIIRPNEVLEPRYLRAYLSSPFMQNEIGAEHYGVTRQALTKQQILNFDIPLAPFNEQKRIADKLDRLLARVDAAKARLDKIPALLKRLRQAILAAATSGKLTEEWREEHAIPEDWDAMLLGVCGFVIGGLTKNSKRDSLPLKRPYLRVANVYENRLELSDVKDIGVAEGEIERASLENGDLLIVEGNGSLDHIGRVAMWRNEIANCLHQNHLIKFRADRTIVLPEYALAWLMSPSGKDEIVQKATSAAGLYTLSISKVSGIAIDVPGVEEQKEIVRRVAELFAIAERIETQYRAARVRVDRLNQSLLAKAFRGELVPQDPNDEPAAALLERIRAQHSEVPKPKRGRRKKAQIT